VLFENGGAVAALTAITALSSIEFGILDLVSFSVNVMTMTLRFVTSLANEEVEKTPTKRKTNANKMFFITYPTTIN